MLKVAVSVFERNLSLSHASKAEKGDMCKFGGAVLFAQPTRDELQQLGPRTECVIARIWNAAIGKMCLSAKWHYDLENLIMVVFLSLIFEYLSDQMGLL